MEPENYMNFTRFSLDYIIEEEAFYQTDQSEPLFGGCQSIEERENSFYAENQTIHCGFVRGPGGYPGSGFDLDEKNKEFMATCIVVVSSCIFGSSDFLRRPTRSKVLALWSKRQCAFFLALHMYI